MPYDSFVFDGAYVSNVCVYYFFFLRSVSHYFRYLRVEYLSGSENKQLVEINRIGNRDGWGKPIHVRYSEAYALCFYVHHSNSLITRRNPFANQKKNWVVRHIVGMHLYIGVWFRRIMYFILIIIIIIMFGCIYGPAPTGVQQLLLLLKRAKRKCSGVLWQRIDAMGFNFNAVHYYFFSRVLCGWAPFSIPI